MMTRMNRHPVTTCYNLRLAVVVTILVTVVSSPGAQSPADFVPVTDEMLRNPAPGDWLMWRRTLDGWGYSPLDDITTQNVDQIRLVWSRALSQGTQENVPIAYGGVLYVPLTRDGIHAIDATTGDLLWEYARDLPEDIFEVMGGLSRSLLIFASGDCAVILCDSLGGRLLLGFEITEG